MTGYQHTQCSRKCICILASIVFLAACILSSHQLRANDTTRYQLRQYTDENGLPQNSVKAIARDQNGNVWLCTEDGLVRFNGQRFNTYASFNSPATTSRFNDFMYDPAARQLFAINSLQEVLRIKDGRPYADSMFYTERLQLITRVPQNAGERPAAPLWERSVGVYGNSTFIFTGSDSYYKLTDTTITRYQQASRKWVLPRPAATLTEQFFCLGNQLFVMHGAGVVSEITEHGLHTVPLRDQSVLSFPGFRVFRNCSTPSQVIIYAEQRFYLLEQENDRLTCRLLFEGFDAETNSIISAFYSTDDQTLLLGSSAKGLFRLTPSSFLIGKGEPVATNNIFYALTEYVPGKVLSGQGVVFVNGQPLRDQRKIMPLISDKYSLAIDKNGFIWSKKNDRLYRADKEAMYLLDSILMPRPVNCLYADHRDTLWIATNDGNLYKAEAAQPRRSPELVCTLPAEITCIAQSGDPDLWIGTMRGLFRYDRVTKKLTACTAFPGKYIRSIYCAADGRTWITTYGDGFFLFQKGKFISFPLDSRGYLRSSHCIVEDHLGFFWIPTNKGLFQYYKDDLINYASEPENIPYYKYYSIDQGLVTNEFNGGCQPCGLQLTNGMIALPSISGVVFLNPATLQQGQPYPITIDEILIDNKHVQWETGITVPRDMSQLIVRINAANWNNTADLKISFALVKDGQDPTWNRVADNRTISLTTLPTGEFTLLIRKQNGFGHGNSTEYKIRLIVPAPWYLQAVAIIGFILAGLLITWSLVRLRLRFVRRQNQALQQQVKESTAELLEAMNELTNSERALRQQTDLQQKLLAAFSHDIKAPMKHLLFTIERFSEALEKDGLSSHRGVNQAIHDHIRRLYHLMNNILQYIKTQMRGEKIQRTSFALKTILDEKQTIFHDVAAQSNTMLRHDVTPGFLITTNEVLFSVILHNLIDNAVKVTVDGSVNIHALQENNTTKIIITDSGIGMPAEIIDWINQKTPEIDHGHSASGLGLFIVKNLADLLQITVHAESVPGKTAITLTFGAPA